MGVNRCDTAGLSLHTIPPTPGGCAKILRGWVSHLTTEKIKKALVGDPIAWYNSCEKNAADDWW